MYLFQDIHFQRESIDNHIDALSTLPKSKEQEHLFEHLYECLSILDSKSSSLLAFNSIISAVFAIFINKSIVDNAILYLSGIGMTVILISCILLLLVVRVHWSDTDEMEDLESHGRSLLIVRERRTVQYRLAWYLSVISLLFLLTTTLTFVVG